MRFDLTDLRVFLQVCEAGSMTAAAQRCHLTLAAVSARVRNLEESNGVVLLSRKARGVAPTPAGEVLAAHARQVLEQLMLLDRELLHARDSRPSRAVLLANSSVLARPLLPVAIGDLLADDTPPGILVRESHSEATVQALRSGSADVGIVSDAVETRGLPTLDLGPDPLVLVVPQDHALAQRTHVAFREALMEPWVGWGEQTALSAHLQIRALALGKRIEPRASYPVLAGVLQLVSQRVGVTVLPQAILAGQSRAADVACVALEEPWAQRRLLVCTAIGDHPVRARLAESIARRCATSQGTVDR